MFPANTNRAPVSHNSGAPPTKGQARALRSFNPRRLLGQVAAEVLYQVFRNAIIPNAVGDQSVYRADPLADGATLFTPNAIIRPTLTPGPATLVATNVLPNYSPLTNNGRIRPFSTTNGWWVYTEQVWTGPLYPLGKGDMTYSNAYYIAPSPVSGFQSWSNTSAANFTDPGRMPYFRPQVEPIPNNNVQPPPRLSEGRGIEISPSGGVRAVQAPSTKPPKGVKEAKARKAASVALGLVLGAFNTVTEVADALEIFWDHMPGRKAGESFYDTIERMMENPELWKEVDWADMVKDLVYNEFEDALIGRLHGLKDKFRQKYGLETRYGSVFAFKP